MRAVVFEAPGRVVVAERPRPQPGPGEVVVRSRAVGICHSDFEVLEGHYILPVSFPVVPGHEWAGEVAEVGAGVTGVRPGDRVVGECVTAPDQHFGLTGDGAAAEYFRARPEWLHVLPDELSWSQGALVEPFSVAYRATRAAEVVDPGATVAILGAGPIGLCCVAAVAGMGARAVVVDPVAGRRDVALALGAEAGLDPAGGDLAARVRELTAGRGADVVMEASGSPAAMAAALELAAFEAHVVYIGIDVGATTPAQMGLIQSRALTIRGVIGSANVWPEAIRFLARARVDLARIVTASFPLEQAADAYRAARDTGAHIKVHVVGG